MVITKVISDGQTGANRGGLIAAKSSGITTGGWIPKTFRTELGSEPNLGIEYGLVETIDFDYPTCIHANVSASNGTLIFANSDRINSANSPGERCTVQACYRYKKPYLMMNPGNPLKEEEVIRWVKDNGIRVLNIAGHRESIVPGIEKAVADYLVGLFRLLREEPTNQVVGNI